jgi:hypothetical protein
MWLAHGLLSSLPIAFLRGQRQGLRAAVVAVLYVVPPFGSLAPCNPTILIGLFFPGTGIAGVAGFVWLSALIGSGSLNVKAWRYQSSACLGLIVALNVWALLYPPPNAPNYWVSLNTEFGENGKDEESRLRVGNVELPALVARTVPKLPDGSIVFLAEGMIYDRSDFTEVIWDEAIGSRDVTFVVGANKVADDGMGSVATVQVFGKSKKSDTISAALTNARAAVTFPATMWHPWQKIEHFAMHWPNRSRPVDGKLMHMSWCYETTTIWPHLRASLGRVDVFVSIENRWSSKGTSLEAAQGVSGVLVSRWLGVSQVVVTNR